MINWNKYFEHVYILTRCSSFDRRNVYAKELKRVGLNDYHWWYNCDNELMDYQKIDNTYGKGPQRATFGHYTLIKSLYELNYDNVLIMEDDNCFLKDISKIQEQLDIFLSKKDECDEYYFDYVVHEEMITFHNCHFVTRKMMRYYIYMMEHYDLINDNYVHREYLYPNNYYAFVYKYALDSISYKDIKVPYDENLLPLQVMLAPTRICVQADKGKFYSIVEQINPLHNFNDYNIYIEK